MRHEHQSPSTPPPATSRRSAAAWSELIREWRKSGASARDFATAHGVKPRSLTWWAWHLRSTRAKAERAEKATRLIPVRIVEPATVEARITPSSPRQGGWELTSADGHVLRVHGVLDAATLRAVLASMTSSGAKGTR